MLNALAYVKTQLLAQSEKDYIRFVISGVFNTSLCIAIYAAGILLGLNYIIANAIAWVIGVIIAYLLNSRVVFRKLDSNYKTFLTFAMSNVFSLIVSMTMLSLLIKIFLINSILASIITIPTVVALNYLAAKFIVFG